MPISFKGLLLPLAALLLWIWAAHFHVANNYLLPAPSRVAATAMALLHSGLLARHILISLWRVAAGFLLACAGAFPLAVLLGLCPRLSPYFDPLLHFLRHIPPIACIPLLILWFGIGETSKLAVIVLAAFFPIFLNALAGITHCDTKLREVGIVFGLTGREIFQHIILPAALPAIILGLRLGLGYSWRALIGAELIAAAAGLGYMIIEAEQLSRPDIILVGILIIGTLGYIIDAIFLRLSRSLLPWFKQEAQHDNFSAKGAV